MAKSAPEVPRELTPEAPLFETKADLTISGAFGRAGLRVGAERAYRYEETPLGFEVVDSWALGDLREPRVEDLVDACALVAKVGGVDVELLRATSARRRTLAAAEAKLRARIAEEEQPEGDDEPRACPKCSRPLPEDSDICLACLNRGQTLLRLFSFAKPYRARLLWGTALILGGTLLEVLPPYFTKLLVDDVLTEGNVAIFGWLIAALVVSRLLLSAVQVARGRNVAYLGSRVAIDIRTALFRKILQQSMSFFDRRNVGSIMSRVTNDTGALYDVLIDGVPITVNQGALLIGIPIAMLLMDWKLALLALLPIPAVLVTMHVFRRRMMRVWSRFYHSWARLSSTLNGILQGARVVKAFQGESREEGRFGRRVTDLAHTGYVAELGWSNLFPIVMFTMSLSGFIVWWAGGVAVLEGSLTIGKLTAFIGYVALLSQPLSMIQRIIDWTSRSLTAAERVFEVLDMPLEVEDAPDAVPAQDLRGSMKLVDVHFGYEPTREVLHGIDLEIGAGEMIGLVGHSGAGKTTLVQLLLRFYDPTQGRIEVDETDLRKIKLSDFRKHVGIVMQESYLFPGSIRDNIAYGRPEATAEEIIAAAKAANAHDFIVAFPDGYDTYVGERGQRMSGGERQRVAIARAILHDPRILILDEATSSVDTETERQIQAALERLVAGRTVIAIAHRLSTLRQADRLVVLEHGRVAEIGTHDDLMGRPNGIYAR